MTQITRKMDGPEARDFDARGVRDAFLASLICLRQHYPSWTLTQCVVALEAVVAEERGEPHTVFSLARALKAPYTTISHVILSLIGDDGVLLHKPHPTDLRKKYVVVDPDKLKLASGEALKDAMKAYYGDSVYLLQRQKD